MRIPVFLLAVAIPAAAADFISGAVADPSGRSVSGAAVECGTNRATTGADGSFMISGAASCTALISHAGFETARIELRAGSPNRVELTPARLSDRVVVSATRTPVTLEESGVSATVYNSREIEARHAPSVAELLRQTPGFAFASSGRSGAVTSLFTRGGASTGTLVLLDGVPLNEPGGQIDFAHLNTAGLDRIEAVRGPESTLFGAEAASGVVQLFTARGDAESSVPRARLSYERGNFQTDHWTAGLSGGIAQKIDYSLTADQFHTAGMFQNDFYRNTSGTANIGFQIANSTAIRAIYRQFAAEAGTPNQVAYGILDRDAENQNRDSALILRLDDSRGSRFNERASFSYHTLHFRSSDRVMDGPFKIAALLRTVPGVGVYLDQLVPPGTPGAVERTVTLYPYPSSSETSRAAAEYQGTLTHTGGALVFGYEFDRQQGIISKLEPSRDNNGGYVHEQLRLGRRLYLTGGARLEHSSTFGSKFAPRASATYELFSQTYLRFSAGRGITEPSLLQNFAQEGFYVGNPRLRPEKTTSYDLGLVREMFARRIHLEATAFRNSFEDLIVFDFGTSPATWRNVDRSWARGLETLAAVRPAKFVQLNVSWTRLYTRITRTDSTSAYASAGQPLLRRPKNSGAAWISVSPRRWTFIAGGRWMGDRQDSDFLFGLTRNPGYGSMYLSGSYQVTRHVSLYTSIDNALDARYQEVLGYTCLLYTSRCV